MPSLRTFRIEFDRSGATYAPGEMVNGKIILDVASEKNIRGLNFSAKGEANVKWHEKKSKTDARGRNRRSYDEEYRSSQLYFNVTSPIIHSPLGDSHVKIPVGYHEYPFTFALPHNIPSSFEHHYGHIRYTVKAIIDRPWKFDHECKAAFTVVSSLDLNANREQCVGINDDILHNFCCCCFNQGSLKIKITVPSSGYVSGQTIDTIVNYNNSSNKVMVTKISTKLEQHLQFYATTPYNKVRTATSEVKSNKNRGPLPKYGQILSQILIPPVAPSMLQYCNIIDMEYKLVVTVHVSGLHYKSRRRYPILIGTKPLYNASYVPGNFQPTAPLSTDIYNASTSVQMPMPGPLNFPTPYSNNELPTGGSINPPQTSMSPHPPGFVVQNQPIDWQMPPPSYEECMSRAENIRDHNESSYVHGADQPFAPRYPVFNYKTFSGEGK